MIGSLSMLSSVISLSLLFPIQSMAHGDLHDQIEAVTGEIVARPNASELLLKRAELRRLHGEIGLALADCQTAEKIAPKQIETEFSRAKILFDATLLSESAHALDRVLAVQPENFQAFLLRGRVLLKQKKFESAALDFSAAIHFAPTPEPEYFSQRSIAWENAGNLAAAVSGLDEGISKLGPIVSLELRAVDLELRLKRFDSALRRIDLLSSQSARKENWLLRRARILEQAGRKDEARVAYTAAAEAIARLPERISNTDPVQGMQKEIQLARKRVAESATKKNL